MIIETKFDIGEKVGIVDFDFQLGRVAEIKQAGKNLFYVVEYWVNGELKSVTLTDEELVQEKRKQTVVGIGQ